ncbi:MAG: hypothetical protein LBU43_09025 [Candidatus Accumulibacter sp.]|jgi:hypothetical protein|nr:hypothetical protein [Accumulibacter sp.]
MFTFNSSTDPENTADGKSAGLSPSAGIRGFEDALKRLRLLRNISARHEKNSTIVDNLYARCIETVEKRLLLLPEMSLPIPQKPRQIIRNMQDMLEALAGLLLTKDGAAPASDEIPPLALWRALRLFSRHLFISNLTAAPSGTGVWKQLHQVYKLAALQGVTYAVPEKATRSIRDEYFAAILLGCAQPTSFSGRDVYFLDRYLERFSEHVDTNVDNPLENLGTFWINQESDAPATPYSRKPPPPGTPVLSFSCHRLVALLENQLTALDTGTPSKWINLPSFASTPLGTSVLNRLIHLWGNPGTRRFPRRSQNYRCEMCFGFDNLCQIYKKTPLPVETSPWMVTNESLDGYAVMHLSGKTRAITVGDIAALRTETGNNWQLCIIRWALSENQEHIELGLQILASRVCTANLVWRAQMDETTGVAATNYQSTLVLSATPTLSLVVPVGALTEHSKNLVLVIERDNVEIREISNVHCDERNGLIELYGITSAWS